MSYVDGFDFDLFGTKAYDVSRSLITSPSNLNLNKKYIRIREYFPSLIVYPEEFLHPSYDVLYHVYVMIGKNSQKNEHSMTKVVNPLIAMNTGELLTTMDEILTYESTNTSKTFVHAPLKLNRCSLFYGPELHLRYEDSPSYRGGHFWFKNEFDAIEFEASGIDVLDMLFEPK